MKMANAYWDPNIGDVKNPTFAYPAADALTAVGNNRATALPLSATSTINRITNAAASTGAILPPAVAGMKIYVINAGASTVKIYASGTDTVDTIAGATGISLATLKSATFLAATAGAWHSILSA